MILEKIKRFETRLKNLPIKRFIFEILSSKSAELEDLNIAQLTKGERSDGTKIRPNYADSGYAAFKNARNPRAGKGTPDLKDTGDFYQGIKVRVTRQSVITSGTDEKTDALQFKYGDEIIGINIEGLDARELLMPELLIKIKRHLGI